MTKNKVTTQGYFIKRMRDSGFNVVRVYNNYSKGDIRSWTVAVNPKTDSIFITCCDNGEWPWRGLFEIDDQGQKFPKGFYINTDSMEVIIKHFLEFNITQEYLNNCDGRQREK